MRLPLKSLLNSLGVIWLLAALATPTSALQNRSPHDVQPENLEGHEWKIENYVVNTEKMWPYHKTGQKDEPYIRFENGVMEGSPGCGRFTGRYHRSGAQLTISAQWTDEKDIHCSTDERKNADQILKAVTNVREIHVEPRYWHSDTLLLTDARGSTQVTLLPMKHGKDLSELQDSFWRLTEIRGSHADFSGVIIGIVEGGISFSTVSYSASFPFQYTLASIEFSPDAPFNISNKNDSQSGLDEQVANLFANVLYKASSYDFSEGCLKFFDKSGQVIIVLNSLRQEGIENRRWRIVKYRNDGTQRGDEDGLIDAAEPAEITFLQGRVDGFPGCGAWEGTYKVSGDHVMVEAGLTLTDFCSVGYPKGLSQAHLIEDAIKGQLRIEQRGDHLLLRDLSGKARILLVPF